MAPERDDSQPPRPRRQRPAGGRGSRKTNGKPRKPPPGPVTFAPVPQLSDAQMKVLATDYARVSQPHLLRKALVAVLLEAGNLSDKDKERAKEIVGRRWRDGRELASPLEETRHQMARYMDMVLCGDRFNMAYMKTMRVSPEEVAARAAQEAQERAEEEAEQRARGAAGDVESETAAGEGRARPRRHSQYTSQIARVIADWRRQLLRHLDEHPELRMSRFDALGLPPDDDDDEG